ncbi:hypothetical protein KIF24_24930 [Micromonospora sp. Llam7]|uniref:hypothetical protein n=1 Tax=Micromonospora tarapacensis TaxID=2835305 RepID=UPI001C835FAF|nr:hypothetical protein [Micromonospora tarapacensis]MBX7268955.1 hypothetical protein [Micromonospora tarapacensis]
MGQLSNDRSGAAAVQLVYLLAGFADNLATVRQAQQRRTQAAAASAAAARLHTAAPDHRRPPVPPASGQPLPVTPAPPTRQPTRSRYR